MPVSDPAPPPPRFRIWIRRQAVSDGPFSVRFEVFDGKGLLRVARPGVLIDPPARPLGFEERLTTNQLRTSRFLLVWDGGRARQGFLLGRLEEGQLERMDLDRWSELETHVEGGFRYLVQGPSTDSAPPPVKAPAARRPSLAELRQALDRMTVAGEEVVDDPDSTMEALTGKSLPKPKAPLGVVAVTRRGPTVPLESTVTLPAEDVQVEPDSDPITPGIVQVARAQRRVRPAPVPRLARAATPPPPPPPPEPPPTDDLSDPSAVDEAEEALDRADDGHSPVARFYESIAGGDAGAFEDELAVFSIDEAGGRAPGEHSMRREIGDAVTTMPVVASDEIPEIDLGSPAEEGTDGELIPSEEAPAGADDDLIAVEEATDDELSNPDAHVAVMVPVSLPLEGEVATPPDEAAAPWAAPTALADAHTAPRAGDEDVGAMHRGTSTLVRHLRRQNGNLRSRVQELEQRVIALEALLAREPRPG